jgi:hypothetical protein
MTNRKALGLTTLTALVVGNMIGSGVFLLPASLAPFGGASLLGWLVTAAGSMMIGLVFARLARRMPAAGGPYAYTREAFGEFAGFLVGWGYWISAWSALAAIAVAMVGYLGEFVPGLATNPPLAAGTAITAIAVRPGNCRRGAATSARKGIRRMAGASPGDDPAGREPEDAVGAVRRLHRVGDEKTTGAALRDGTMQECENVGGRLRVEVAGGFIGEQQLRPMD